MLSVYQLNASGQIAPAAAPLEALATGAFLWADLYAPTGPAATSLSRADEEAVEAALGVDVPTPQERAALEHSARFYEEDGALVLTATLMGQRAEGAFISDGVTFILARGKLATVRAIRPRAFEIGQDRAAARLAGALGGPEVLMALLQGVVERAADVLAEGVQTAARLSAEVFDPDARRLDFDRPLRDLGRVGALAALAHDSLTSIVRLLDFAKEACARHALPGEQLDHLRRDAEQLERTAEGLQAHAAFLLDATLGIVGARQNKTLRTLSLATVAFVPPTLIASIFGMNFMAMNWFAAPWGPWAAFGLMLAAPVALVWIARARGWF